MLFFAEYKNLSHGSMNKFVLLALLNKFIHMHCQIIVKK